MKFPALCVALVTALSPQLAHAESPFGASKENGSDSSRVNDPISNNSSGDGVYGRFSGDLSLRAGLGVEADLGTDTLRPALFGQLSFYQSIGLYTSFRESVEGSDPVARVLSFGGVISPLFLLRWSRDLQSGHAFADLTLDSLGIAAGAQLSQPQGGSLLDAPGLELGLVFGVPLMARANGLWLRGRAQVLTGRTAVTGQDPAAASFFAYLAWEGFFFAGLIED